MEMMAVVGWFNLVFRSSFACEGEDGHNSGVLNHFNVIKWMLITPLSEFEMFSFELRL